MGSLYSREKKIHNGVFSSQIKISSYGSQLISVTLDWTILYFIDSLIFSTFSHEIQTDEFCNHNKELPWNNFSPSPPG